VKVHVRVVLQCFYRRAKCDLKMRKKLFNNFFRNEVHDEGKQSEKEIFMSEYEKSHAD